MAVYKPLTIFSKHAPFGGGSGLVWIDLFGQDYSGATIKWGFAYASDLTSAFILSDASAGSQGVLREYSASETNPLDGVVEGRTRLTPQVDASTLAGLTFDGVNDLTLLHTLYVTPSGGTEMPVAYGSVTVKQGAPDA